MPPSLPACARYPGRNRNHWPRSTTLAAHMSRKTLHPAEMPDYFATASAKPLTRIGHDGFERADPLAGSGKTPEKLT